MPWSGRRGPTSLAPADQLLEGERLGPARRVEQDRLLHVPTAHADDQVGPATSAAVSARLRWPDEVDPVGGHHLEHLVGHGPIPAVEHAGRRHLDRIGEVAGSVCVTRAAAIGDRQMLAVQTKRK